MVQTSAPWRPAAAIRPIAIGIIERKGALLVMAVTRSDGVVKGWRPLGGGIEFGETAAAALEREMGEELGQQVEVGKQLGTFENIFEHEGAPGHEIVFVYRAELHRPEDVPAEGLEFVDFGVGNRAAWVPLARFGDGSEVLYPLGLLELLLRTR